MCFRRFLKTIRRSKGSLIRTIIVPTLIKSINTFYTFLPSRKKCHFANQFREKWFVQWRHVNVAYKNTPYHFCQPITARVNYSFIEKKRLAKWNGLWSLVEWTLARDRSWAWTNRLLILESSSLVQVWLLVELYYNPRPRKYWQTKSQLLERRKNLVTRVSSVAHGSIDTCSHLISPKSNYSCFRERGRRSLGIILGVCLARCFAKTLLKLPQKPLNLKSQLSKLSEHLQILENKPINPRFSDLIYFQLFHETSPFNHSLRSRS